MENDSNLLLKNNLLNSKCSKCGCDGVHACLGQPIIWTEEDKLKFKVALSHMFGWDKNGKNK